MDDLRLLGVDIDWVASDSNETILGRNSGEHFNQNGLTPTYKVVALTADGLRRARVAISTPSYSGTASG